MLRVVGAILLVAVYIYCIIDVLRTPGGEARTLPKWLWVVLVIFVPIVGSVLWLILGRVWRAPGAFSNRRRGPVAPDDDPAFLKKLGDDAWSQRMRRRRSNPSADGPAPS
ncbi:MAG: hypothetical protein GC156_04895 [Actinomycetales bacterium]|nr:hypothetical protein [Actinomycetales bacterium]